MGDRYDELFGGDAPAKAPDRYDELFGEKTPDTPPSSPFEGPGMDPIEIMQGEVSTASKAQLLKAAQWEPEEGDIEKAITGLDIPELKLIRTQDMADKWANSPAGRDARSKAINNVSDTVFSMAFSGVKTEADASKTLVNLRIMEANKIRSAIRLKAWGILPESVRTSEDRGVELMATPMSDQQRSESMEAVEFLGEDDGTSEFTDEASAKKFLDSIDEEREKADDEGRSMLFLQNLVQGFAENMFFVDPYADNEPEHLEAMVKERSERGLLGQTAQSAVEILPSLVYFNAAGAGAKAVMSRMGVEGARLKVLSSMSSFATVSALHGGDPEEAAEFGFALGVFGPSITKILKKTPLGRLVKTTKVLSEAANLVTAGVAVHGYDPDKVLPDAVLGAMFGLYGALGKSKYQDLKDTHKKWQEAKTDKLKQGWSEVWMETLDDINALVEKAGAKKPDAKPPSPPPGAPPAAPAKTEPVKPAEAPQPKAEVPKPPVSSEPVPKQEAAKPEGEKLGVSRARVDVSREARGEEPVPKSVPQTRAGWKAEAERVVKKHPLKGEQLVKELEGVDRAKTPVETEILLIRRAQLQNEYKAAEAEAVKAADKGDVEAAAAATARVELNLTDRRRTEMVLGKTGSEAGRGLVSLKAVAEAEDISRIGVEMALRRTNNYEPLSEAEKAQAKDIGSAAEKAEIALTRALESDVKRLLGPILRRARRPEPTEGQPAKRGARRGSGNKIFTRDAYDAAVERVKRRLASDETTVGMGEDPRKFAERFKDALIIGGHLAERGTRNLAEWSKEMVKTFGKSIQPHLDRLWQETNKTLATSRREEAVGKIKEAGDSVTDIPAAQVKALTRGFIAEGLGEGKGGRDRVVDAVHEVLKETHPDITKLETMDAMAGYGKVPPKNTDQLEAQRRQIEAEIREVRKQIDMEKGEAPKRTGGLRDAPESELREQKRRTENLKRKGGFTVRDRRRELNSALDPVKKRLTNEIKDLNEEIRTRERLKSKADKTPLEYDAETRELLKKRDELKKTRDEVVGKKSKTLTYEQRQKIAEKYLERSNAEKRRKIKEGDVFATSNKTTPVESAKIKELREESGVLDAEIQALRDIARPKPTRAQRVNKTRLRNLNRREKDLLRQLNDPDLTPKAKSSPVSRSPAVVARMADVELVRQRRDTAVAQKRWRDMHWARKITGSIWNEASDVPRAVKASLDFSFMLRQGIQMVLAGRLRGSAAAFSAGFKALRSRARHRSRGVGRIIDRESPQQVAQQIKLEQEPLYKIATEQGGVEITKPSDTDRLRQTEEFRGKVAKHVPGVAASGRMFETQGNWARIKWFQSLAGAFGRTATPTPAEAKIYGAMVNIGSGRAQINNRTILKILDAAGGLAWAPKLVISQFQKLTFQPLLTGVLTKGGRKGTARARAVVGWEMARSVMGYLGIAYLMDKAGVETFLTPGSTASDSNSSDFGKFIVRGKDGAPDTRYDFGGGIFQAAVFASRFASGSYTDSRGNVEDITGKGEGFRGRTRGDVTLRFFRTKASPWAGVITTWAVGQDFKYDEPTVEGYLDSLLTPLALDEMHEAFRDMGFPQSAATAAVAFFGIGVAQYDQKTRKTRRKKTRSRKRTRR